MAPPAARAIAALALLAMPTLIGPGCAAPTLPLPPPEIEPLTAPDAEGMVTVEGRGIENALVFVFNEDLEDGVITVSDDGGLFQARISAQSGHMLTVWQRVGPDDSQAVSETVP